MTFPAWPDLRGLAAYSASSSYQVSANRRKAGLFSMTRSGFQSRRRLYPDVGHANPTCEAVVPATYWEVTKAVDNCSNYL